jgi:hypothetical protein
LKLDQTTSIGQPLVGDVIQCETKNRQQEVKQVFLVSSVHSTRKKVTVEIDQTTSIGQPALVGDAIQLGKKSLLKLDQTTSIGL